MTSSLRPPFCFVHQSNPILQGTLKPVALQDLSRISAEELELVPSPATGTPGALTPPREFNLMFQTSVGAMSVRLPLLS